jgi:hypothetical protein
MKRMGVLVLLLAMAACSKPKENKPDTAAEPAALANKDEKCPGGTVKGCFTAAREAEKKGDAARAFELHERVCEAGVARECTLLGSLAWQGRGVSADPARAYALYMRGCEGDDAAGCFNAAICHRTGACAEKDEARATNLLRRACDGNDKRACDALKTATQ